MTKKEFIEYLIKQRNLDWQYFENMRRLDETRFRSQVEKLKNEVSMWRFVSAISGLFLALWVLCEAFGLLTL